MRSIERSDKRPCCARPRRLVDEQGAWVLAAELEPGLHGCARGRRQREGGALTRALSHDLHQSLAQVDVRTIEARHLMEA